MKTNKFESEAELAAAVIQHHLEGWDVYQEVQLCVGGPIADIVAVKGRILWVIETKLSMSMQLLEQAYKWKQYANYVSIATPHRVNGSVPLFAQHWLQQNGIGWVDVRKFGHGTPYECQTYIGPKLFRRPISHLRDRLVEQHKTFAKAGSAGSGHWTPFKQTCREIEEKVAKNPGLTIKEIFKGETFHYRKESTARSCMLPWMTNGKVKVRIDKSVKPYRVYPIISK
jgi:hypothetical protein